MSYIYTLFAVAGWIWLIVMLVVVLVRWRRLQAGRSGHRALEAVEQHEKQS